MEHISWHKAIATKYPTLRHSTRLSGLNGRIRNALG